MFPGYLSVSYDYGLSAIGTAQETFLENRQQIEPYEFELRTLFLVCSSWTEGPSNFRAFCFF